VRKECSLHSSFEESRKTNELGTEVRNSEISKKPSMEIEATSFSANAKPIMDLSALQSILEKQDTRKVNAFEATKLEKDAKKNWDIFYKRNQTNFFKDRHWTLREFQELVDSAESSTTIRTLFEVGCGCGNFLFPILEQVPTLKIYACDFSPRAVDFVK